MSARIENLTFSDYLATVINYVTAVPATNVGTAAWNVLSQHRADLANAALAQGINPSTDDTHTEALLDWLALNWETR